MTKISVACIEKIDHIPRIRTMRIFAIEKNANKTGGF
jgi:hypothetical protein